MYHLPELVGREGVDMSAWLERQRPGDELDVAPLHVGDHHDAHLHQQRGFRQESGWSAQLRYLASGDRRLNVTAQDYVLHLVKLGGIRRKGFIAIKSQRGPSTWLCNLWRESHKLHVAYGR